MLSRRRSIWVANEKHVPQRKKIHFLPKVPQFPGLTIPILSVRLLLAHGGVVEYFFRSPAGLGLGDEVSGSVKEGIRLRSKDDEKTERGAAEGTFDDF